MILELPVTLAERYEVSRFLGAGSFAETYYAQDLETGQDVAVKVLRPQFVSHRETLTRFEREAQATSEIIHPNVVRTLDYRMGGDSPFMVMEYVPGPDLKVIIQERGRLTPEDAVTTTVQILTGLDAIHQSGMVHRDVKPHNVLSDPDHGARLSDFGIARALDQTGLTKTGTALGTASYMAPEQATGREVTPATDVYAVGVMLFEMLTGRTPFSGNDPLEVLYQQVHQAPPSLREHNPDVPEWLDRIALRAMSKEPVDRYESANSMIGALNGSNGSEDATRAMDPAFIAAQAATAAMPARPTRRAPSPPPRPQRPQRAVPPAASAPARADDRSRRSTWWRTPALILLAILLLAGVVGALYALGTGDPPADEEPATIIDDPADDEPAVDDVDTEAPVETDPPVEEEAPAEPEAPPDEAPADEAPEPAPEEPEPAPEEEEDADAPQEEEPGPPDDVDPPGQDDNPGNQGGPPPHAQGEPGGGQNQGNQGNQGQGQGQGQN